VNSCPSLPTRCWRSSTGPGESSLMSRQASSQMGHSTARMRVATVTSSRRLALGVG